MTLAYYVYYRVLPGREREARACTGKLLAEVEDTAQVRGRLLVKRGEPDLWMEVYEAVPESCAFEATLAQAAAAARIGEVLAPGSMRKVECFHE